MISIRERLKKIALLKALVVTARIYRNKYGALTKTKLLFGFFSDFRSFRAINTNEKAPAPLDLLHPRIFDKTSVTNVGVVYFYQDTWCARKVFDARPGHHYDIGSKVELVGILSQFTPTTMIDIRPINLSLEGLAFVAGNILSLPFTDESVHSLSSICVIEHIGLGRYGDALDPIGSEKAARELVRVIAPNGNLYISLHVDRENAVHFNAHRTFTRDYALEMFAPLELVEEKYIYGDKLSLAYDPARGFGTGLYHFRKSKPE
ncbi:MAG TPA: DUF268 domain-containing protein [Candidatus Paceibacterota bacterium]